MTHKPNYNVRMTLTFLEKQYTQIIKTNTSFHDNLVREALKLLEKNEYAYVFNKTQIKTIENIIEIEKPEEVYQGIYQLKRRV